MESTYEMEDGKVWMTKRDGIRKTKCGWKNAVLKMRMTKSFVLLATVDFQYFGWGEVKFPSTDHHCKNTVVPRSDGWRCNYLYEKLMPFLVS